MKRAYIMQLLTIYAVFPVMHDPFISFHITGVVFAVDPSHLSVSIHDDYLVHTHMLFQRVTNWLSLLQAYTFPQLIAKPLKHR